MKKLWFFLLIAAICSCSNQQANDPDTNDESTNSSPKNEREEVDPKPVASYTKDLPGDLNNWKFHVDLKETKQRFDYLLDMQYQEVTGTDTIHFPNFGMEPRPEIRPGENELECIIGFLDKKNEFREYIKVFIKDDQLRVKTLKQYAVYEK